MKHTIYLKILLLSFLLLSACTNDLKPENFEEQRKFFKDTITQVQQASQLLQQSNPTDGQIKQAMEILDSSMFNANSMETDFLNWLDSGMYQSFNAYLVRGIENYRFGVELEDREQQAKGIALLQKWWHYWQLKQPAVTEKLSD